MDEVPVEALRGVDFDVSAGESVVLPGPSGSAKSTLPNAIERGHREPGTATVVTTHNAAIAGVADFVVRLFDGRIAGIQHNASKVHAGDLLW